MTKAEFNVGKEFDRLARAPSLGLDGPSVAGGRRVVGDPDGLNRRSARGQDVQGLAHGGAAEVVVAQSAGQVDVRVPSMPDRATTGTARWRGWHLSSPSSNDRRGCGGETPYLGVIRAKPGDVAVARRIEWDAGGAAHAR